MIDTKKEDRCEPIFLNEPVLAMAYVPMQKFNTTFPPVKGLLSGTLFPELRKPFRGKRIAGGDGYAD